MSEVKTLVLGLGNLLLADEGFEVHAARTLNDESDLVNTTVLDTGTAVLDSLTFIEEADLIIILDAVKYDGTPGTIYRMRLDEMEKSQCIASMHGFDMHRVLALTKREFFPEVLVIGVEPAQIEWSMELSTVVENTLQTVKSIVKKEITSRMAGQVAT